MPGLGDLLQLLHDAGRFRTARAEFRGWYHHGRAALAFQALAGDRSATVHVGPAAVAPKTSEVSARLWLEPPDRARVEREGGQFAIRDGESWWSWTPNWGATTNVGSGRNPSTNVGEEFLLYLNPAPLIGALEWTLGEWRDGEILATAIPRVIGGAPRINWELSTVGTGADSYAFVIDADAGVLKRVESRFDGEPFQITETLEFALDEELPPETFVFEAPDGSTPQPFEMPHRTELPVSEIIEHAAFTIFVPAQVPRDWRLSSRYTPARRRPHMAENVSLWYRSDDGTQSLSLSESALADRDREFIVDGNWEDVERDGRLLRVRRRSEEWSQPQLYCEVEETAILMSSDTQSADDLIGYALSLKAAT